MSDFEIARRKSAAQKAEKRKDALISLAYLLGILLAVCLVIAGLEYIGFISKLFMVILISGAVLVSTFNAGGIWNTYKRKSASRCVRPVRR